MKTTQHFVNLLIAVALIAALPGPVQACGPFFPDRILVESDQFFLQLPYSRFSYEARQVPVPYEPAFRVVPPSVGEHETPGEALVRQTQQLDLEELGRVLEAVQPDDAQRQKILADYWMVREVLSAAARTRDKWVQDVWFGEGRGPAPTLTGPLAVPDGLPGEFADYLRGAIAYWQNDMDTARRAWQDLLRLPADERRHRSTWAAYMLGRSYLSTDAAQAMGWFRKVGELAKEGYHDSLGLAAASLGWEAQIALRQRHYATALELYRVQLAAGEISAPISLLLAARHAAADAGPEERAVCAANPTARRLITAYLLCASVLEWDPRVVAWLDSFRTLETPVDEAERLAWAAYQTGNLPLTAAWLARAPEQAPIATWLRAKLLLREGKITQALPLIAQVATHFPRDRDFRVNRETGELSGVFDELRAQAEIGGIRLGRGEYVAALDVLVQGVDMDSDRHWLDVAYVGEQVLTLTEFKEFVDRRWPTAVEGSGDTKKRGIGERMRYLVARRLARHGQLEEALPYYPADIQSHFRQYMEGLRSGKNAGQPRKQRAEALWAAAQATRHRGMEFLGTEADPDWAWVEGSYDLGTTRSQRPKTGVNRATQEELSRAAGHRPRPDRRYHYRYLAADLAWEAGALMPDQSEDTARVLALAGTWLKNIAPKEAERFYKALVRRCGKTRLGQEAQLRRWFPEVSGEVAAPSQ
ncbi:MAG TPA: hypothetical protein DEO88_00025 [Syntrophobacteraceae bacterium]|nr:hypothetical protein [Syntrophobacteraceae bacterium]